MTVGAITSQSLALQVDECSQLRQLIFINRIRWDQPLALAAQIVKPFPFATDCTKQSIESFLLPHCLQKYVQILFQPALVKGFSCRMKFLKLTVGEPRPRPVLIVNIVMVIQTKEDKLGATSQIK